MNRAEKLIEKLSLWEMANLWPKDTGLAKTVYVSEKNASHGPRIKVDKIGNSFKFSVSISNNPKVVAGKSSVSERELKEICEWILLNKDILLGYWNGLLSTVDLALNLKKLE